MTRLPRARTRPSPSMRAVRRSPSRASLVGAYLWTASRAKLCIFAMFYSPLLRFASLPPSPSLSPLSSLSLPPSPHPRRSAWCCSFPPAFLRPVSHFALRRRRHSNPRLRPRGGRLGVPAVGGCTACHRATVAHSQRHSMFAHHTLAIAAATAARPPGCRNGSYGGLDHPARRHEIARVASVRPLQSAASNTLKCRTFLFHSNDNAGEHTAVDDIPGNAATHAALRLAARRLGAQGSWTGPMLQIGNRCVLLTSSPELLMVLVHSDTCRLGQPRSRRQCIQRPVHTTLRAMRGSTG